MIELFKNKTNFILIINNEHFHFIFSEKQYDRVFPMLRLNEEKFKDSILKVYKSIKGKKELKTINLLTKDEYVNKTKTFFLKLITENVGQIAPDKKYFSYF